MAPSLMALKASFIFLFFSIQRWVTVAWVSNFGLWQFIGGSLCEGATWSWEGQVAQENRADRTVFFFFLKDSSHLNISVCVGSVRGWLNHRSARWQGGPKKWADHTVLCNLMTLITTVFGLNMVKFSYRYNCAYRKINARRSNIELKR